MPIAKKSLGQNFLMHAQTAARIVGAANLPREAVVLEIGPGTGMLTKALLAEENVARVVAVEADDALAPELEASFEQSIADGRLSILHEDIREFDPASLGTPYHVVANIPYYITGEIIRSFLSAERKPESMTILVQKEVAERVARNHGKESLLSLSIKAYGDPSFCFTVPRGAFKPAPSVDSAVLSIRHINSATFPSAEEEEGFFSVLRAGFAHKRKRLAKNLEAVAAPERVRAAFERSGLKPDVRAEDVPAGKWRELAHALAMPDRA